MKLNNFLLLALVLIGVVACKYDDDALWDKVNSLDERVTSIEEKLSQMNSDINAMSIIVNALQNKVYVESVTETGNGYQIKFTDGKTVTIKNGENGKDAPVIGVDEFEGKYYWVQIIDGTQSWLTDKNGDKLPVTGADAITPVLRVNAEGYWLISYDHGITFETLLDENGNPVKAVGKDGENGKDAPVISVDEFEGKYYWVQIIDGTKSWLTDKNGSKLPVTGADAVTPILKVNAEGYWLISYDRGITFEMLLDESGNPVKAVGKDGTNGTDGINGTNGTNGEDGDSFFSNVEVENGILILILKDGTVLKLPIDNGEDLPEYIAFNPNLDEEVDYAILGLDGSGYFYKFQNTNPNIPQRLSIYNGNEDVVSLVINFDNEGLPKNILSESFTIVLGNHTDNKFDAVVITKEGESAIFEDVTIDYSWEDYKVGLLTEANTRAVSHSPIKWVNAIVGATGCGLSIAGTIISTPTGVGAVVGWGLTSISCTSAILSIADAAGWVETPDGSATANTIIGHYANLASCASINNPVSVAACLTGLINNVTSIADLVYDSNKDDIALGEGSLISGNGEIKVTLTWDNYADIDLHCIDPSGYHIYYADKVSTTGGFLDYDNTVAYGPENIYFSPALEGAYHIYLHYYAENQGIRSVNYKVAIYNNGIGQTYEGTISGRGTVVDIATILFGHISNTRSSSYKIDWNNLPLKKTL